MTESIADQLALLVRDRAEGRISVADYRRLRAPLLDRLVTPVASAIDEASLATRPRVVTRAPEQVRSGDVSELETVFAPPSRMGLWALGMLASGAILVIGLKHEQPSREAAEVEIELVQVTTRPVTNEPPPEGKARVGAPKERSLLQPPATEPGPRIITLPPQSSGAVLGVSARAISQSQFRAYCEETGRPFPRQPWEDGDPAVANVTWNEANDYARWLSNETGLRYRLSDGVGMVARRADAGRAQWVHYRESAGVGCR